VTVEDLTLFFQTRVGALFRRLEKWESSCVWGWNIQYRRVGATAVAQRWPFQTNVGWLNTPNYESDGKIEEKEAPSTVLSMRLWLCREECMKSTFGASFTRLWSGPTPAAMGGEDHKTTLGNPPPNYRPNNPLARCTKGKDRLEGDRKS